MTPEEVLALESREGIAEAYAETRIREGFRVGWGMPSGAARLAERREGWGVSANMLHREGHVEAAKEDAGVLQERDSSEYGVIGLEDLHPTVRYAHLIEGVDLSGMDEEEQLALVEQALLVVGGEEHGVQGVSASVRSGDSARGVDGLEGQGSRGQCHSREGSDDTYPSMIRSPVRGGLRDVVCRCDDSDGGLTSSFGEVLLSDEEDDMSIVAVTEDGCEFVLVV